MDKFLEFFEKAIVIVLILLMVVIIFIATIVLGAVIVRYVFSAPNYMIDAPEMLDVLGYVLLVLIGIELLETVKAYLSEHVVHVEIVLEVALIAVARKVILLDYKEYSGLTLLSIAALIIALSLGFYLEKRGRRIMSHPVHKRQHLTEQAEPTPPSNPQN